jgi:3-dehydroquinate dehydratase/shikimate dehydrogenase
MTGPGTALCVSLMPETTEEGCALLAGLARRAGEAAGAPLMAELRLDAMREADLSRLLGDCPCPVVVTCRPKREGGLYEGDETARLALLRRAARLGAEFLDIEHDAIAALGPVPARRIVSYHNFRETPADLAAIHARLARTGAEVVKVAVMARHILDTVAVLRVLRDAQCPTIALSMGPRGVLTRLLAPKFGAFLTYAAADGGGRAPETRRGETEPPSREAGPGQVTLAQMRGLYRTDRIGPDTRVFGVVADPVGHSLSPAIHNAAFAELGLDAVYLPFWVEGDPAAFVRAMREFAFDGYSVTIPHKQAVMAALDDIEPLAGRIGAVNTVQRRPDERLFGTNTDLSAGIASIEAVVGAGWLRGKRALVLGAGGVGRAMAFGLVQAGANVTLADLDAARATALAEEVGADTASAGAVQSAISREASRHGDRHPPSAIDLVLNCTPVGMHPSVDASPVPTESLRPGLVVYDAVYNPLETRLLRGARRAGCRTVAGIDHFVRQAVEQFELWTGRPAPVEVMRRVVVEALA